MKLNTIILLSLFFSLSGCVDSLIESDNNKPGKIEISNKVEVERNNQDYFQFPGTRIFIQKPERFISVPTFVRLQKGDDTFVQAFESEDISFARRKDAIEEMFANDKGNQLSVHYKKEFKLGDYDAYFLHGGSDKPGYEQMVLIFGDSNLGVLLLAEFRKGFEVPKQEIFSALLTAYVDRSAPVDLSELERYELDVSGTDFLFLGNQSQTFYYTIEGKGDPLTNLFENQIVVVNMPSMNTRERIGYANSVLDQYRAIGINIISVNTDNEFMSNGIKSTQNLITGSYHNVPLKIYQLITGNDEATVSYSGVVFQNNEDYYNQVVNISKTLKVK